MSRVDAQAFACGRLVNPDRATSSGVTRANDFVFSDGETRLPYRVFGDPARMAVRAKVTACNFVVVHDFFDSLDKTDALFRPVTRAHSGCRVLAFNYPGQAGAVLGFPPCVAASSGGSGGESAPGGTSGPLKTVSSPSGGLEKREPSQDVPNNSFIACKLHDLLQYVHAIGEMTLTAPFHLVGIGNGVAIAVAFALRYGDHPLYRSSLRSIVSINGFASVDPQLAAILHSSLEAFAALPPARADLSMSFISRFVFSEDYLKKVGRNLALGIYTAVADPISLEGRQLVCRSALSHEDFSREVGALGVPTVLLQSTEDLLIDPSNVDPFLRGRTSVHHFWSHEFPQSACGGRGGERDSADPAGGSVYGRKGLTDLLRALSKPRGTFVAWVRAGHEVRQEAERAVSDLLDALAKPTPEHLGVDATEVLPEEGKGGAGEAMGLYPSADFVARLNIRCDGAKQNGSAVPSFVENATASRREHHAAEESRNILVGFDGSQQRPSTQEGKIRGGANPPPPAGGTPQLPSPFPKDIEIPPIPARIVRVGSSCGDGGANVSNVIDRHRSSSAKYFSTRGAWEAGGSGVGDTALSLRDSSVVQDAHSSDDSTWQTRASSDVGQHAPGYESLEDSPKSSGIPMDLVSKAQSLAVGTSEPLQRGRRRWAVEPRSDGGAQAQDRSQGDLPAQEELDSPPGSLLVSEPTGASQGSQTHTGVRGLREYLEEEARLKARWYLVRRAVEGTEATARAVPRQQIAEITREQEALREAFANEDRTMIAELEAQLSATRRLLDANLDAIIVGEGLQKPPIRSTSADAGDKNAMGIIPGGEVAAPAGPMPPFGHSNMENSTVELTCARDSSSGADDALRDGIETLLRRRSMDEPLGRDHVQGDGILPAVRRQRPQRDDLDRAREQGTSRLHRFVRGHFGRRQGSRARRERANEAKQNLTATIIPTAFRGRTARVRVHTDREKRTAELLHEHWVVRLQRVGRRMLGQRRAMERRKGVAALNMERYYRGHLGRRIAACARAALEELRCRNRAALCIQTRWRCNRAVQDYSHARVYSLAAVKIQKVCRGVIGRKRVARRLEWERTTPGPARLKLGIRLMEETQASFEKQRLEIAALRNAERRAGIQASRIRSELDRSKKELGALERERNEIDRMEDELSLLTHERCLLRPSRRQPGQTMLSQGESPSSAWGVEGDKGVKNGRATEATRLSGPKAVSSSSSSSNVAEAEEQCLALDIKIQIKHAEWDKAKQDFEADFSGARDKVNLRRRELDGVIAAVREMESTRGRKTMGLRRLQANIIELLREQTAELNSLKEKEKEKGIQPEVATVTSAAAAASAVQRIKDHHHQHEERGPAVFSRSEEIMRLQLAYASLGYSNSLNSLNKLKTERDTINDADTLTATAVASNAATAAAAAFVRAPAASIPSSIKPGKALESGVGVVGQEVSVNHENAFGKASGTAREDLIRPPEVETFLSQVRSGRLNLLERSLEKGFPVDAEDHHGNTALIVACQNCKMEVCEMLLRRGADVNHGNFRGNTALHYAMVSDPRGAIVEMLISSGGDDTVVNKDGLTCYGGLQAVP